jgi:heat shock protein HtpX
MIRIFLFLITNLSVISLLLVASFFIGISPQSLFFMFLSTICVGFGGAFISLLLSKKIALISIGGKIINSPANEQEEWILKTIKKQALSLGLKVPELSIYNSNSVNAFATGPTRNSSLIAISSGLINSMNKNEIKSVIAHEISHINNGDMVTMTLIQGVVNTFVIFLSRGIAYLICLLSADNKSSSVTSSKNKSKYFFLKFVLEIMFGMLSSCVTMWFSRRREFYADAGAAKLSGVENMISALKVLKNYTHLSNEPKNVNSLCINGNLKYFLNIFSSHPPIDLRIKALYKKKYM